MTSDLDIYRSAKLMADLHGDGDGDGAEAEAEALKRADLSESSRASASPLLPVSGVP